MITTTKALEIEKEHKIANISHEQRGWRIYFEDGHSLWLYVDENYFPRVREGKE